MFISTNGPTEMTCQDDTVPRSYKRSMVQSHTYQSVQHLTVALPLIFRRERVDVADLRPRDRDHLRSGCVPDSIQKHTGDETCKVLFDSSGAHIRCAHTAKAYATYRSASWYMSPTGSWLC